MFQILKRCMRLLWPGEADGYRLRPPLVLINGLAEQPESWFCNRRYWEKCFDVKMPEFLVYDGVALQRRIEDGLPITVDYLTDQLEQYLDFFVQRPPYHLVGSSLGCQIAIEFALRRPDQVDRMVLLCPSGFGGEEKLPVVDGVRRNDFASLVGSVFFDRRHVRPEIVRHYERQFASKTWKKGVLRTIRGTSGHSVRDKLHQVSKPVLLICGEEDRITDPRLAAEAVKDQANFRVVLLPRCGHAPQIERARQVNRLVRDFLTVPISQRAPLSRSQPAAAVDDAAERLAAGPNFV